MSLEKIVEEGFKEVVAAIRGQSGNVQPNIQANAQSNDLLGEWGFPMGNWLHQWYRVVELKERYALLKNIAKVNKQIDLEGIKGLVRDPGDIFVVVYKRLDVDGKRDAYRIIGQPGTTAAFNKFPVYLWADSVEILREFTDA